MAKNPLNNLKFLFLETPFLGDTPYAPCRMPKINNLQTIKKYKDQKLHT